MISRQVVESRSRLPLERVTWHSLTRPLGATTKRRKTVPLLRAS
jgi:hypothetical protein